MKKGWPFPIKDGQPYIYPWMVMMVDRDPLLVERQATHGSFADNAKISQDLKCIVHKQTQKHNMEDIFVESLDMICLKMSRILSGQACYKDHWDDIAGYAKLASEACDATKST